MLAGCATRESIQLPDLTDWDDRQAVLGGVSAWEFSGRIGVRAGDDGFNGKLRWSQVDEDFKASVSGPLGIGTVRLEGDAERVELTDKDGVKTRLENAEADLYFRYGWTIPVSSLRYWALGIPDPRRPATTALNEAGQLETLEQGAWQVRITRYSDGAGQPLPSRLTAVSRDTRVRLVIDKWSFFDQ